MPWSQRMLGLPALVALALTAGCRSPRTVERLTLREPGILTIWVNPSTGDSVKVMNGGYGSAIAMDPTRNDRFFLLSDRGPNYEHGDGIAFPMPEFAPEIGVFERRGQELVRSGVITLKDDACRPLSGRPLPLGRAGSTGEIGYAVDGTLLAPDSSGVDSEGLLPLRDGSFWVSDEYGPFLLHVNHEGCTIERLGPADSGRGLPRVVAKRRDNRGFEGLTSPDDGRTLVAMLQAPLDNPKPAGRDSRLVRILAFDTQAGTTRQFGYLLESPSLGVSDILALGGTRYLVLERDGKFPQAARSSVKRFYTIDLAGASDLSDPANSETGLKVGGATLEELTATAEAPDSILRVHGIVPVEKALAFDLLERAPWYPHDKVEGATLIAPGTIAIINDDDFGVTDEQGGLTQKLLPGVRPPRADYNEVVVVRWQ